MSGELKEVEKVAMIKKAIERVTIIKKACILKQYATIFFNNVHLSIGILSKLVVYAQSSVIFIYITCGHKNLHALMGKKSYHVSEIMIM